MEWFDYYWGFDYIKITCGVTRTAIRSRAFKQGKARVSVNNNNKNTHATLTQFNALNLKRRVFWFVNNINDTALARFVFASLAHPC